MAGKSTISTSDVKVDTLKLSSSTYGVAVPLVWGRTRISSNLLDYVDFTATAHTTKTSSGGKGGGGVEQSNTTYTYDVGLVMALCEGKIAGIGKCYVGKKIRTIDELGLTIFDGRRPQGVWDYLTQKHSGQPYEGEKTIEVYLDGVNTVDFVGSMEAELSLPDNPFMFLAMRWKNDKGQVYRLDQDAELDDEEWKKLTKVGGIPSNIDQYRVIDGVYTFHTDLIGGRVKITANGNFTQDFRAIPYAGMAYVAGIFDLGNDASLPNFGFEVVATTGFSFSGGIVDEHPVRILSDFLTNPYYGAGFSADYLGDWSQYDRYCTAHGIFLSPALVEQAQAQEFVRTLMVATNSQSVWSEGKLKIVPYEDAAATGNGVTFTPNNQPIYDLTNDDFLVDGDDDPVKVVRTTTADAYNHIQVEFLNRNSDYNIEIMSAYDAADIEDKGLRPKDPIKMHAICDPVIARTVAQLELQRSLFIRNVYEFTLDWKYVLLEPMDVVTLTEETLGLDRELVRIIEVEENDEGTLTYRAEECPEGVAGAAKYPSQTTSSAKVNYNCSAGNTVATIFTAPDELSDKGLDLWIAAGGGETWGGCQVWVSEDGDTYQNFGNITVKARRGTLTADMGAGDNALSVRLESTSSRSQLFGVTADDAQALRTLCYADGEFFAYQNAILTGEKSYDLTYLVRGAYNSEVKAHAAGSSFVRCDDKAMFSYPFKLEDVGKRLYIKLLSFNIYGAGMQNLTEVNSITHVIRWSPPPSVSNISLSENTFILKDGTVLSDIDVSFSEPVYGYLSRYDIYYELDNSGAWLFAGSVTGGTSNYALKALPNTKSVKVKVVTINKSGNPNSGVVSASYTITGKSNPPENVKDFAYSIDPLDRTKVILTWTPVKDVDLKGYVLREVRRGIVLTPSPIPDTRYVYTAATSGTYEFSVVAQDNSGNPSSVPSVKTVEVVVEPPDVTNLSTTQQETDRSQLILSWDAIQAQDLSYYEIRCGTTGWDSATIIATQLKSTRHIHQLTAEGSQTYLIKAVAVGGHASKGAATSTVQVKLRPDAPTNLAAMQEPRDRSMLKISWTASEGKDLAGYDIFINSTLITLEKNTNHWWMIPASGTYTIEVRARTVAGYTSNFVSIIASPMIEADDVTGFTAVQQVSDRTLVRLMWDSSSGDMAYCEIRKGVSWDAGEKIGKQVTGTFFDVIVTDESLQTFWIKAVTSAGKYSQNPAKHEAVFNLNPLPVRDIVLEQDINDRSKLNISFSATPESDLANYEIRVGSSWSAGVKIGETKELRWTYSPERTGDVNVLIRAINAAGFQSDEVSNHLYVKLEPDDVTGFRVFQNGEKLAFVWYPVENNDIVGYELREGSNFDNGVVVATGITLTQYQLEVDMEILRRFHIKAINRAGRLSNYAASTSVTIIDLPPKNVIDSYDEVELRSGMHNNTEFGASAITFATLGGKLSDYPTTRFSDIGGATVLKLKKDGGCGKNLFNDGGLVYMNGIYTGIVIGSILTPFVGQAVTVSCDIKGSMSGNIACYGLGDCTVSYYNQPVPITTEYTRFTFRGTVATREFNGYPNQLSFYSTYGSGINVSVKNIVVAIGAYDDLPFEPWKPSYYTSGIYSCVRKDMGQLINANIATVFQPSILYTAGTTASLEYRVSRGDSLSRRDGTVTMTYGQNLNIGTEITVTKLAGIDVNVGDVLTYVGDWRDYFRISRIADGVIIAIVINPVDAFTGDFYVNSPANWTDWQPFAPVEVTFRYLDFRVKMSTKNNLSSPEVNQLMIRVDVPDKDIAKSVTIPVGGATVQYGHTFFRTPVVSPTAEGTVARAIWSNKTTSSVFIKVVHADTGADIGGEVDLRVKGY